MAPMLLDHSEDEEVISKTITICSDPSVVVSENAPRKTKELWWMHGHPHSKRYKNPALNSLSALIRHDGTVFNGQKAFLYPLSSEPTTNYGTMTWDEFDGATESLAMTYAFHLKGELEDANITQKQPTIALLGGGKTIEYFCTELALQKLGVRVLLLAESNAQNALHHLLETCNALAIITDSKVSNTDTNGIRRIAMIEELPKSPNTTASEVDAVKFRDLGDIWERHTFIIHSSGSTGMPKPIIHTNRSMMLIARMYRLFQEFEVENWFLLFPLYHIAGISIALSNLPNGTILSFPPLSWPPSSSSIFSAWKTLSAMGHPVDIIHCAPTLIENMYDYITSTTGDFSPLTSLKVLQPGGAALSGTIVQALVSAGVNVKTTYGSTEIGPPMRTIPHSKSNPKCYTFRNLYPDSPFLKMEQVGEGLYECVVYKGFELAAELWEGKADGEPYRTNDLFIQDPPGSGNYLLQGRKDDILVHSNGENTSAGPLQLDIQTSSKYIAKALALGHSRPCVALLVELHDKINGSDEAVANNIWTTVEEVNARYPKHSEITRSMIYFLPPGSMLPVTPKGNVKRKEAESTYASAISVLYEDEVPELTDSSTMDTHSRIALSEFLRKLISSITNIPEDDIKDWTTFYELGINSRLALTLRSKLSRHLSRPISLGTIFENPSISQFISFLSPSSNSLATTVSQKSSNAETVNRIISRLESDIKSWPLRSTNTYPHVEKHTILLTGASGSLGTALLQSLSASPYVSKIYALIRGTNHVAKLEKAMIDRDINPDIVREGGKVKVLNFSMQDPLLGLSIEEYSELAREVTVIIANAWVLDFNRGVEEFEGDCLRNTMSLLRLCHAGRPKTMAFTSSVSTCMGSGHVGSTVNEEPIGSDPAVALSTGYALSKYIAERVLLSASSILSIPTTLLRVGQLCGSTTTSQWNTSEMWPIMFASSFHESMRCVPSLPAQAVDWVPVNIAAETIRDLLLCDPQSKEARYQVHNITNPNPIPWSELVEMLRSTYASSDVTPSTPSSDLNLERTLEVVPMANWVARLNALADAGTTPEQVPALKLLQFFEDMAEGQEPSKLFETNKTTGLSRALKECPSFLGDWINGNVKVWKKAGFIA